jgi:hypothetical protein
MDPPVGAAAVVASALLLLLLLAPNVPASRGLVGTTGAGAGLGVGAASSGAMGAVAGEAGASPLPLPPLPSAREPLEGVRPTVAGMGGGGLPARLVLLLPPPAVAPVLEATLLVEAERWREAMRLSRPQPAGASAAGVDGCGVVCGGIDWLV